MKTKPALRIRLKGLGGGLALLTLLTGSAFAQPNVLQPTDPIIASSANSPGSEGVKNAIDGTQAKYLNFDSANDAKTSGFVVTPAVGSTWVTGVAIQTANDAPDRDVKEFTLEGSNDDSITNFTDGNWTLIVDQKDIPAVTTRFTWQNFSFSNFAPYKHYRWTVVHTQGPSTCCMQVAEVQILGVAVPKNVLQPTDPILASSANSPGSEGVKNAIDGTQAKYLNFDSANDAKTSGFEVSPAVGATVAQGVSIQTANDAPDRDVKEFTLEGSNDDAITNYTDGTWTLIADVTNIPPTTVRFAWQTFLFPNVAPYKHYRWTVVHTQGPSTCCMQVAEVQILGTGAPKNVLVPTDPIIASSANSPGSEGVKNAIDGTQAKYLNFDQANDAKTSGFVVTPAVGPTTITGVGIQTANDAPDRDVKEFTLEGSNDEVADYTTGTWTLIADVKDIPATTARFAWQYSYFANGTAYKHYRWTVVHTQGPSTCCMQVAEVQLLAVTSQADCGKAAFVTTPVDSPVLNGSTVDLFVSVNGPWPLQWYTNGVPVPGASQTTFTTDPITAANSGIAYSVAIVGCQTSPPVHAVIFTPSTTVSLGVQFQGGGANGAPTTILTNDIVGVQQQAYWVSASGNSGTLSLNDSGNNASTITFDFNTSGTWGAGVGSTEPVQRLLNGLVGAQRPDQGDQTMVFHNVPAGSHAVLIYSISPPLQFQNVSFSIPGQTTIYQRTMNSDEYKLAPGFYRSTSTSAASPSIGDFVRFDGVHPDANGDVAVTFNVLTAADRQTGVNAIQLVLNAPNPGSPPVITTQPQPTVAPSNGVATLTVVATGSGLTYQWRKDGQALSNGGAVSGANTASLTINPLTSDDEGVYSVAIFNQAGSTVSANAAVYVSKYSITDGLVSYWKFDESSGTTAANSASGGLPANLFGTTAWGAGKVANALTYDGTTTYGFVSNYTKATKAISGSAWLKIPSSGVGSLPMTVYRNEEGEFQFGGTANRILGQFDLSLVSDGNNNLVPSAVVGLGNNYATNYSGSNFPIDNWAQIGFSADGAQLRLYVNGAQVSSIDYTGDINPPSIPWISIGARVSTDTNSTPPYALDGTNPNLFAGQMDELALWTRVVTASEMNLIYLAGKTNAPLTSVQETPPIVVQPPKLTVSKSGSNLIISWSPAGGTLKSTPAILTSGSVWTTVGTANPATVPIGAGNLYFGVFKP